MAKADRNQPPGEHAGKRHLDPKHERGDWWPPRPADTTPEPERLPDGVGGWPVGRRTL